MKEKAKDLVGKFTEDGLEYIVHSSELEAAKNHALICVDELIAEHSWNSPIPWNLTRKKYWQSVKSEIKKL